MDAGLKVVSARKVEYRTYQFDFDNGFSYVEKRANARVTDCYFAETDYLYPDGSVKKDGRHYFHCFDTAEPEKEVRAINCLNFDDFDKLFFINDFGEVERLTRSE